MILFRLRDLVSVIFWRCLGFMFGGFGRRVRIVRPRYLDSFKKIVLGDGVAIQEGAYITVQPDAPAVAGLKVGSGTLIGNRVHIVVTHEVEIGRDVLIADNVFIADCSHVYADPDRPIHAQGLERRGAVAIGDNSWIGEGAAIIGARIGCNCVIGALSVVTRDVPDLTVVAGAPAIAVKRFCEQRRLWLPLNADGSFRTDSATKDS